MTENALKGIYNGGTIPFGYMIDETRHYQRDPLLAPYVEQTFQKYADGATMTDLRDWLKAHNIKNSMGGEMSYNTIQRMLSSRRYIGELHLRDVVQPNAIPALVSGELVGARPLHLAPARTFCRLKAPLGLSLLCKCGRSKREIKNDFSAEDAQSASGGHFKSSMPRRAFCNFL